MNVSELRFLKDKSGGVFGNNGKLTKPLKFLVNRNFIFEYGAQLAPLDAPYVAKKSHKPCFLNSGEYLMLQKNLKGEWVVLYGIEVYTPYVIDEGTVAAYVFVSTTNHEGQTIRARGEEFLTELGK